MTPTIAVKTNECLIKSAGGWFHFTAPHRILRADELQDVISALREVEDLVEAKGWHAAGFLSYEASSAFDSALQTQPGTGFPYLWFGLYPPPRTVTLPEPARPKETLTWHPTLERESYKLAVERIKDHIAEGKTYQVNYTMRLRTDFNADPWDLFLHLAQSQNDHGAYIDTGRYVIASASPELFFQLDGDTITCRPMKGTVKRGRTTAEDFEKSRWLKNSGKNRAENVMIVDMIRNDLGRIAEIGSVHVPELFTVERYPTLWQMTSMVQAKTKSSLAEIFTALFPCASITGAPKVSTMRIISELETTPRKIYTGSIGYLAPNREAEFNVAIRTALIDRETQAAEYGVGGGIVWDSTSTDEYAEALLKARVLTEEPPRFSLLETMLWTPGEGFFLREKHVARILDSADYFGFPVSTESRWLNSGASRRVSKPPLSKEIIGIYLDKVSSRFNSPQRLRMLLDKKGKLTCEAKPFQPALPTPSPAAAGKPLKVRLAKEPIHSNDAFLFHKTTHRNVYDSARKDFPDYDDVLLYNEHGELTEFTIGNLVVEMDEGFFTPPVSCGLLAGTFREHLLETNRVAERTIRLEELKDCAKIFLVNSVRKWQRVECDT